MASADGILTMRPNIHVATNYADDYSCCSSASTLRITNSCHAKVDRLIGAVDTFRAGLSANSTRHVALAFGNADFFGLGFTEAVIAAARPWDVDEPRLRELLGSFVALARSDRDRVLASMQPRPVEQIQMRQLQTDVGLQGRTEQQDGQGEVPPVAVQVPGLVDSMKGSVPATITAHGEHLSITSSLSASVHYGNEDGLTPSNESTEAAQVPPPERWGSIALSVSSPADFSVVQLDAEPVSSSARPASMCEEVNGPTGATDGGGEGCGTLPDVDDPTLKRLDDDSAEKAPEKKRSRKDGPDDSSPFGAGGNAF